MRRSLALVALSLLPGCAPDRLTSQGPVAGVVCPPPNMIVVTGAAARTRYEGASAEDPSVCIVLTSAGTRQRWLAALVSLPSANEAEYRGAFARLFPLALGRDVTFRIDVPEMNTSNITIPISVRWQVTGEEVLTIEDQRRPVWRLQRTWRNLMGNTTQETTVWIDKATGAPLASSGSEPTSVSGRVRPYRAIQVIPPQRG